MFWEMGPLVFSGLKSLPFMASSVVRLELGALCKGNMFSTTQLCLILMFYPVKCGVNGDEFLQGLAGKLCRDPDKVPMDC